MEGQIEDQGIWAEFATGFKAGMAIRGGTHHLQPRHPLQHFAEQLQEHDLVFHDQAAEGHPGEADGPILLEERCQPLIL